MEHKYTSNIEIIDDTSNHQWEKKNLMTICDKSGCYDLYECKKCGFEAKMKTIGYLIFTSNSQKKIDEFQNCSKHVEIISLDDEPYDVGNYIIVTNVTFKSSEAKDIIRDSEHKIVKPPSNYVEKYPNSNKTVWIMGQTEPVRLLQTEFKFKS